jgi:hypothetical protein
MGEAALQRDGGLWRGRVAAWLWGRSDRTWPGWGPPSVDRMVLIEETSMSQFQVVPSGLIPDPLDPGVLGLTSVWGPHPLAWPHLLMEGPRPGRRGTRAGRQGALRTRAKTRLPQPCCHREALAPQEGLQASGQSTRAQGCAGPLGLAGLGSPGPAPRHLSATSLMRAGCSPSFLQGSVMGAAGLDQAPPPSPRGWNPGFTRRLHR